jgi:hypothetical protein
MKRLSAIFLGILCVILFGLSPLFAAQVDVVVQGTAMPWSVSPSLNSSYPYGINNGSAATAVSSLSGISFASGNMLTIQYLSGLTSAYGGSPTVDANGYTSSLGYATKYYSSYPTVYDNPGSTGQYFPTKYIALPNDPSAAYYLNALIGVFADSSAVIVGNPFFVGNGPLSIAVPTGATQLLLGLNDDNFGDNTGSLTIRVSGSGTGPGPTPTPEPTTMLLIGLGLAGLAGVRRFRK